ncbi:hypothetical protein CYCD_11740 [Tenuifilaceae bacterium CYCD]|nr:hypothetical protein CYCD_11740 [Tenuifilaceae bacterium CYCD]
MKKLFVFIFTLIVALGIQKSVFSQISLSYYSSSLSKIGVAYKANKLWTELRLYSNTSLEDITPELVLCFNIVSKEKHNLYIGIGGNANYYKGVVLPFGVQFTPFEKMENFSLHIEFQPSYDFDREDTMLQSSWGLRYTF